MFKKKTQLLLTILFVTISIISCQKDEVETPIWDNEWDKTTCTYHSENFIPVSDQLFSEAGIIPLNLDNFWRYADSTWDANGNLISSDEFLIQVKEVRKVNGETWWTLNYPIGLIHQSNDKIYDIQVPLSGCSIKEVSYFLFNEDSISKYVPINGDVMVMMDANKIDSVQTPAGLFLDCYYYHKVGYGSKILKPNMGSLNL